MSKLRVAWLRLVNGFKQLKRPILTIAAVGAVVGGLAGYWNAYRVVHDVVSPTAAPAPFPRKDAGPLSIAVLPFANHTGDLQKTYIADGLTSSITADLYRLRDVFIVPLGTAVAYKEKSAKEVGEQLGIRFVLVGSVMAADQKVRITAQLADTRSGAQEWTEVFEGDITDLFALLDKVTARIGNSISREMVILAARDSEVRKSSGRAADLILRANALKTKPQSLKNWREIEALQKRALAIDPQNSAATIDLALTLVLQEWNFPNLLKPDERERLFAEGAAAAEKARAIDPENPTVHRMLAMHLWNKGDVVGALRYAEKYATENPHNPDAQNSLAVVYQMLGQPAKSIDMLNKALSVYPRGNSSILGNLGAGYFMLGDNSTAILWAQKAIETGTGDPDPYTLLAMAYAEQGDAKSAGAAVAEARRRFPDLTPPPLGARECAVPTWCDYLRTKYLPAWRRAGLP